MRFYELLKTPIKMSDRIVYISGLIIIDSDCSVCKFVLLFGVPLNFKMYLTYMNTH